MLVTLSIWRTGPQFLRGNKELLKRHFAKHVSEYFLEIRNPFLELEQTFFQKKSFSCDVFHITTQLKTDKVFKNKISVLTNHYKIITKIPHKIEMKMPLKQCVWQSLSLQQQQKRMKLILLSCKLHWFEERLQYSVFQVSVFQCSFQ